MSQKIFPFIWFNGKAGPAAKFYASVFKGKVVDQDPMSATFRVGGHEFIAFNGGPYYKLNPAISLMVPCRTQVEIDYYWKRLSAGGKILQCGWVTDKFGVTWQIVPTVLKDLLGAADREKAGRAMQAMMRMKKLDIAALKRAFAGH
jgi:predicted 3-demethylubiquinone-9 3-methyltransferase (glyoxalase superfamily)